MTVVEDHLLPFHLVDDDASPHPYEVRSTFLTDCGGAEAASSCEADSPRNILAQAYVRVRFDLPSNGRVPPFVRNVGASDADITAQLASGRDDTTVDSPSFWVGYLQGSFQPQTYFQRGNDVISDGDPEVEHYVSSGLGVAMGTGALIFVETTRDYAAWPLRWMICGVEDGEPLSITVAHEVGHQFGARHEHGGIMGTSCPWPPYFSAEALDVLRSRRVP